MASAAAGGLARPLARSPLKPRHLSALAAACSTPFTTQSTLLEGRPFPDGDEHTYADYRAAAHAFKLRHFPHLVPEGVPLHADDTAPSRSAAEVLRAPGDEALQRAAVVAAHSRPAAAPAHSARVDAYGDAISPWGGKAADVEREYWRLAEGGDESDFTVEYGNDQDVREVGSGFPRLINADLGAAAPPSAAADEPALLVGHSLPACVPCAFADASYYRRCGWNLNNLAFLTPSLLRHVAEEINGVNVPWLYVGSLFTTFCWHNEDHHLYSCNYMHAGEAKTWYGVPGVYATRFEHVLRSFVAERQAHAAALAAASGRRKPHPARGELPSASELRSIIYQIVTMMPPAQLTAAGVPVYRLLQEPGHFVITFPAAFHAGFSHGFNLAEASNFALPDWLPFGLQAVRRYRAAQSEHRALTFSHEQLICHLARHAEDHPPAQWHWCVAARVCALTRACAHRG